jgi:hypothetical protein
MLFQRDAQALRAGCPSPSRGLGKILFFAFFFCPLIFLFASGCITNPPEAASVSLAAVAVDGKWGYIDASGKEVIPLRFDEVQYFTAKGLAAVRTDKKWGYIDANGREVISPRFEEVRYPQANGLAAVRTDKKWGYIDANGKEVIPPRFDAARDFTAKGLAAVAVDGKWGFIDASGREVIPLRFDDVRDFSPQMSIPAARKTSEAQYAPTRTREKNSRRCAPPPASLPPKTLVQTVPRR